jgi:RNA recognition motif-containing protein
LSQYGKVQTLKLHSKKTGESRGFGFASFANSQGLEKAIAATHSINGKIFECKKVVSQEEAKKKEQMLLKRKIFVGGLKKSVTEQDLLNYFNNFGAVEKVIISREHYTDISRGCGFVIFKSIKSAKKTLYFKGAHKLHGKQFGCKSCKSREEINGKAPVKNSSQKLQKNKKLNRKGNKKREREQESSENTPDKSEARAELTRSRNFSSQREINLEANRALLQRKGMNKFTSFSFDEDCDKANLKVNNIIADLKAGDRPSDGRPLRPTYNSTRSPINPNCYPQRLILRPNCLMGLEMDYSSMSTLKVNSPIFWNYAFNLPQME